MIYIYKGEGNYFFTIGYPPKITDSIHIFGILGVFEDYNCEYVCQYCRYIVRDQ